MVKRFDYVVKDGQYKMRDNGKILTHDEILDLLNEFDDEKTEFRDMVFKTIDDNIKGLEKRYEFGQTKAGACPMHNIQYSINVLKDLKRDFLNKMLGPLPPFNPSLQLGRCRCVLEPVNIDCTENSEEKAKRLKEALEGIK